MSDKFLATRGKTSGRGFVSLISAQLLGAFNDKGFMTLITLYLSAHVAPSEKSFYIAVATALFITPFILFSTYCGYFADKFSKRTIMLAVKCWEIFIMFFGLAAFYFQSMPALFGALFCLGIHSTLYSPAKYGILPEILTDEELSNGNGILELTTFVSIIAGTIAASLLFKFFKTDLYYASFIFIAIACMGLCLTYFVPRVPPSGVSEPFRFNFIGGVYDELKRAYKDRALFLTLAAITFFWLLATAINNNIITYSKDMLQISEDQMGFLLAALAIGIGFGSGLAGKMSGDMVEFGLVPLGSIGMTMFLFDLNFSHGYVKAFFFNPNASNFHMIRTGFDLFMIGLFAGLFMVPLHAYLQVKAPNGETGRIIGLMNFTSNIFMVFASFMVYFMHDNSFMPLNSANIFAVLGVMTLAMTVIIIWMLPDFLLRLVFFVTANIIYRIKLAGEVRLPISGPAMVVANHASLADVFILNAVTHRHIRFMLERSYYERSWFQWLFRMMKVVLITSDKPLDEEIAAARAVLADGKILCSFPEIFITDNGLMKEFKYDPSKISEGLGVRVYPACISGMWGSMFGMCEGRPQLKMPEKLMRKVHVEFGAPLTSSATVETIRRAIEGLLEKAEKPAAGDAK